MIVLQNKKAFLNVQQNLTNRKEFFYLKFTLKAVDFFEKCKNEIRVSFFNTIFCNTTIYFYVGQAFGSITVLLR